MIAWELTAQAENDLEEIWDYIARDNPTAANRQTNRFIDVFDMLGRQPEIGESLGYVTAGLRCFSVGRYMVYYEIEGRTVRIRRVLHGARDVRKFFGSNETWER